MTVLRSSQPLRCLDFDIETRRVGFHSAGKWNPDGCEPVIIYWSWVGSKKIDGGEAEAILGFLEAYAQADVVTGHYIRRFDLPILNGAMMEAGQRPLSPKLTIDTKLDLGRVAGLSKSQANLSAMYDLAEQKLEMLDHHWRQLSRLEPDAIERAKRRCYDDVKQHKELLVALQGSGFLKSPKEWKP